MNPENRPGQYGYISLKICHGHYHVSISSRGAGTEQEAFYGHHHRSTDEWVSRKLNYFQSALRKERKLTGDINSLSS